ncbi:hypothetical protein BDW59DRAFT_159932 [Aspergillus cavernicola]|uniref:Uncharacterized protein n=1 Tax=Aspergillus cavernicola TaxID=176166 RepID=A0ABR4IJP2_9EURO
MGKIGWKFYLVLICPSFVYIMVIYFFFPETKGRTLEGIGALFGDEYIANSERAQLLYNLLEAQAVSNTLPKTVLLQLSAKYYGDHLGPTTVPQEETDALVLLEPNFYCSQEDCLTEFAKKNHINWITTRPSCIPGAIPNTAMNVCLPLAIYAAIQKCLGKSPEIPDAQNQSFKATDDCAFTWGNFWPKLAARFGIPRTGPETDQDKLTEVDTPYSPPPRGFGPPGKLRYSFMLVEWAKRPEVQDAWKAIASQFGLRDRELWDTDRVFGFTDAAISWSSPIHFS